MSIAIVGVLLGLVMGGISVARSEARRSACMSSLRSGGQLFVAFAKTQNRGCWPNMFDAGQGPITWVEGETQFTSSDTLMQTGHWVAPLIVAGYITRGIDEAAAIACPEAARLFRSPPSLNAQSDALNSYHYSASLYTRADLWDPERPERRIEPDNHRASVGLSDVAFPSRKSALFEIGDYHGTGLRINQFDIPGKGRCNVVACDGHVATADPYGGPAWLALPWEQLGSDAYMAFRGGMPFSSSAHGSNGVDLP